jgi:hypothetical protein
MKTNNLPDCLSVGYRTYEIIPLEAADFEMTEKYGWCDKINSRIYIYTGLEPMIVADTLLHEVLHATWAFMGLDEKHDEEAVVTRLGTGLLCVFYDNPDLVDYIRGCITETQEDSEEQDDNY